MDVTVAVVRSHWGGTQHANGFDNLARIRPSTIGILNGAFAGCCAVVITGAASVRHGQATHSTGEVGGRLAPGRGGSPAAVAGGLVIFGENNASHTRKGWVVVRVKSVLLHFLAALLLCRLVRLTLTPEEEQRQDNQCHRDNWDNDCNGDCSAGRKTARACC